MSLSRRAVAAGALALATPGPAWAAPAPLVFYGAQPGQETLDEGHGGGNPFASALIELLAGPKLTLGRLPAELRKRAFDKSEGFQTADTPTAPLPADLDLRDSGLRRVAIVAIQSTYAHPTVPQLPGAARDGVRVAAAFSEAGFAVTFRPNLPRETLLTTLDAFAETSRDADVAVVYATGHGLQSWGVTHLLMGDYAPNRGEGRLGERAVTVPRLAAAACARQANLCFWAGCRTPFLV